MLSLPVLAVLVITQVGTELVADRIVIANPLTSTIEIFNPSNGEVYSLIDRQRVRPVEGIVTKRFGEPHFPYQPLHTGLDIAGVQGDSIFAFMDGTVTYVGNLSWGYGTYIILDHGDNLTSLYAHLSGVAVAKGDYVRMGTVIGYMGNTGWSTGPHLHFEVKVYGIPVNPEDFI